MVVQQSFLIQYYKNCLIIGIAVPDGRPIYWALKLLGHSDTDHLPGYYVTTEICKLANKKNAKLEFMEASKDVQRNFIKI